MNTTVIDGLINKFNSIIKMFVSLYTGMAKCVNVFQSFSLLNIEKKIDSKYLDTSTPAAFHLFTKTTTTTNYIIPAHGKCKLLGPRIRHGKGEEICLSRSSLVFWKTCYDRDVGFFSSNIRHCADSFITC